MFNVSEKLFSSTIENIPVGIIVTDCNFNIKVWNAKQESIFNINRKEVTGKNLIECFPILKKSELNEYFEKVLIEKKTYTLNDYLIEDSYFNFKLIPIKDEDQNIEALIFVIEDITKTKLEEQKIIRKEESYKELTEIFNEAVKCDKLRTEFFVNISHELKTPLNVIFASLQMINLYINKQDSQNDNIIKYIDIIKKNCFRLLKLVNNIIDITRMDADYFDIDLGNHNIVEIVEDITLSVADYIEIKSIQLIFDTEIEEKIVACDPDKIERIMLNLLSNAAKFTDVGGKITVTIFDKGETIVISVKDTGKGIPEDKVDAIFERFTQGDKSLAKNQEGSGIGLSIVKSLVEMHGGNISVKSKCGVGSEFLVELPVKVLPNKEQSAKGNEIPRDALDKIAIEFSDI